MPKNWNPEMMPRQPNDLDLVVMVQGASHVVINLEELADMLSPAKLVYLNGLIAARMVAPTGANENDES